MRTLRMPRSAAGFTLVEMAVSIVIFAIIGYGLVSGLSMGQKSQTLVFDGSHANEDMRRSSATLAAELQMARETSIVVTELENGSHQLDFMVAFEDGGQWKWGACDAQLGDNESWTVRYTVEDAVEGDALDRRLVRQVLDEAGTVRRTNEVAGGLTRDAGKTPAFRVAKNGDVWEITIATAGHSSGVHGEEQEFHVKTRN